jgi:hypothetical protein
MWICGIERNSASFNHISYRHVGMTTLVVSINDGLATILPLLRLNIVNCYVVCIKTSDALLHGSFTSFENNKGIKLIIVQDYKWI